MRFVYSSLYTEEECNLSDGMQSFHPVLQTWFVEHIGQPSPPQQEGWPLIAQGKHVLIVAPTGSGKTLAAFLQCLNALYTHGIHEIGTGVRILYISPLKALNNDIYRNLEVPLQGIQETAVRMGITLPTITHAVRTGDTSQSDRQRMIRKPPHILITTPESLYLLLTSKKARHMLRTVEYVIVDEIHSLYGEKRGVHLSLSLERLQAQTALPILRIGLSATIEPLAEAAAFLGGGVVDEKGTWMARPVAIVDTGRTKKLELLVTSPVRDYKALPEGSIWPSMYSKVLSLVKTHHSTLVFVNNRAVAEKMTLHINELAGEIIAKTHHGCISRESRLEVEQQLKSGKLACLVATSSLELGIDIGALDLVIQIASPKSVARGLQRIGRAGHRLDVPSKGVILPRTRSDLLEACAVAGEMLLGHVESVRVPQNCLDVLSQQVVAMTQEQEWKIEELLAMLRGSYAYHTLTQLQLESILKMLTGGFSGRKDDTIPAVRLVWDQINGLIRGNSYGSMLAISNAGTIPDRGFFPVYLEDRTTRIGELDEVFVFESRLGDRFVLGSSTWRYERIEKDRVIVSTAHGLPTKMPFWQGEGLGRPFEFGIRVGAFLCRLEEKVGERDFFQWLKTWCPIDEITAENLEQYILDQKRVLTALPTDQQIVIESFSDEVGDHRMVIHSVFGGRVNGALSILFKHYIHSVTGCKVESSYCDDGILLHLIGCHDTLQNLFSLIPLQDVLQVIMEDLPNTPVFGSSFQHAISRSLMLGVRGRKRMPLWIARLKAQEAFEEAAGVTDHPMILEAYRECLEEILDIPNLFVLLSKIQSGEIHILERTTVVPSPFTAELLFGFMSTMMYEEQVTSAEKRNQLLVSNREMLRMNLGEQIDAEMLDPRAIQQVSERLAGRLGVIRTADALHHWLHTHGDCRMDEMSLQQLSRLCSGDVREWLQALEEQGRILRIKGLEGDNFHMIATEEAPIYAAAFGEKNEINSKQALLKLIRKFARFTGPFGIEELCQRIPVSTDRIRSALLELERENIILKGRFLSGIDEVLWCHSTVWEYIRKSSLQLARNDIKAKLPSDFSCFLLYWQGVGQDVQIGSDRLIDVLRQFQGVYYPASWWEDFILPLRVSGYRSSWLDQLCTAGQISWIGWRQGSVGKIAWVVDELPPVVEQEEVFQHPEEEKVLRILQQRGASFLFQLVKSTEISSSVCLDVIEELVWNGNVTNDSFEAVRYFLAGIAGGPKVRAKRIAMAHRMEMGRWSVVEREMLSLQRNVERQATGCIRQYGFITKEIWNRDDGRLPWSQGYPVIKKMELLGKIKRGYFLTGLSGVQFASREAVEGLMEVKGVKTYNAIPACDPSLPYGSIYARGKSTLSWSALLGTVIVLESGSPIMVWEKYGEQVKMREALSYKQVEEAMICLITAFKEKRFWQDHKKIRISFWGEVRASSCAYAALLMELGFEREMQDIVLWRKTA